MRFTAIYVEATTNKSTANILFADPESNPEEPAVLLFSRAIEFDNSAYYFEVNDQSYGSYEGLEMVELSPTQLKVRVEPQVVAKFEQEDWAEIMVDFEIDEVQYQLVADTLQQIFAGTTVLTINES